MRPKGNGVSMLLIKAMWWDIGVPLFSSKVIVVFGVVKRIWSDGIDGKPSSLSLR